MPFSNPSFVYLFMLQLFCSVFMTGLIWFVQVVHYPLFEMVEKTTFPNYAKRHQWLTGFVVAPIMLIEVFSALYIIVAFQTLWINFLLVFAIWLSTACLQIPLHGRLSHHYDIEHIRSLVGGNWLRTVLWTFKSYLLIKTLIDFMLKSP